MFAADMYRSGDHQPVIPINIPQYAHSDVEAQAEAYDPDRQGE